MEHRTPLKFEGSVGHLYWLVVKMFLLNIVTLGIYTFWGYSNIRRYLTNCLSIKGHPYLYHGTGLDLFTGFLKFMVGAVIITLIQFTLLKFGIKTIGWHSNWYITLNTILSIILISGYLSYVLWRVSTYQMSQTSWRGIRYKLKGKPVDFMFLLLRTLFLNIISLGFMAHKTMPQLYSYIFNNFYFGDQPYRLKLKDNPLMLTNIVSIILFIPTLGISRMWYTAKFRNYIYGNLEFMDLKFNNTVTFRILAKLYVSNILIFILTFGLGIPWIIMRTLKNYVETIEIVGNMDKARFLQMETAHD